MNKLLDKLVIFILCFALYITNEESIYSIVIILIATFLSAVLSYFDNYKIAMAVLIIYIITCFLNPTFLYFIPVICYDAVMYKKAWSYVLVFLPVITLINQPLSISKLITICIIPIVCIIKYRNSSYDELKNNYINLRDTTKEISLKLERNNKELLEKQDYEINLATLRERNRIARDIHDNVGHLLSRSILQVGALLAINKDTTSNESLVLVKNTLTEAMDSIRSSVHDLHEESIDLHIELQKIIDNFKFCKIKFDYNIKTSLDKNIKYCFIAITKEALSNIIKHSNATEVYITIREHPALYQLVIQDNGTKKSSESNGIGLTNISDRVKSNNGIVNISFCSGFRIFISIPKNRKDLENESSSC